MVRVPGENEWVRKDFASILNEGRLECAHCHVKVVPEKLYGGKAVGFDPIAAITDRFAKIYPSFSLAIALCGACGCESIFVRKSTYVSGGGCGDPHEDTDWLRRAYPPSRVPRPFPSVPDCLMRDYRHACEVLSISPPASACMSRRCLQSMLTKKCYDQSNLAKQIDALLLESDPDRVLPSSLRQCVDAIRNFGNFGAHGINDLNTAQIIEVEEGEAEWCIELTEQLLDHYYEQPALAQQRLAAANLKIMAGGKPPIKS